MSDEPYSKRELDFHFVTINDKLDSILAQTTKTNGRVTKCEGQIDLIDKQMTTIRSSGKVANWAFGLTIPLIISMAVWIFFNQIDHLNKKDVEILQILEAYNK